MKIKAGIIGAAGYTGGELLRILVAHPDVEIVFAHSKSQEGKPIGLVHRDLFGLISLKFTGKLQEADVLFLCLAHGDAAKFLSENTISTNTRIIDLSQDFRLEANSAYGSEKFVYGLPELNQGRIAGSRLVANPGCFATAIQLALLPLAANGLLRQEVQVNATTGSTGAGQSLSDTSHFSWRQNNLSVYKAFNHQHLPEIRQSLLRLDEQVGELSFIPQRGAFTRGILATVAIHADISQHAAEELFKAYYLNEPFTFLVPFDADLKQVVNTNKCHLQVIAGQGRLLVVSVIDNLVKGASGQAVQNMNLMFNLEEGAGLALKASAF